MEEMFYFSERDRKMAEIGRLHETDIEAEAYANNPCFGCPYYDEYAGCTFDPIDEEWYCYKEKEVENVNEE